MGAGAGTCNTHDNYYMKRVCAKDTGEELLVEEAAGTKAMREEAALRGSMWLMQGPRESRTRRDQRHRKKPHSFRKQCRFVSSFSEGHL